MISHYKIGYSQKYRICTNTIVKHAYRSSIWNDWDKTNNKKCPLCQLSMEKMIYINSSERKSKRQRIK